MGYPELRSMLAENHIFPDYEELVKENSREITGLRITACGSHQAEVIKNRLEELLVDIGYRATFFPNHDYILVTLESEKKIRRFS